MAFLRRHSGAVAIGLLVLIMAVIGVLVFVVTSWPAQATEPAAVLGASPKTVTLDPVVYSYVQQVRDEICLTDHDLAALACGDELATDLLARTLQWCQTNLPRHVELERKEIVAADNYRQLMRKVHVGPRDAEVMADIPAAQKAYRDAVDARLALTAELKANLSVVMSKEKRELWLAAQETRGLPLDVRYLPEVTASEKIRLAGADDTVGRQAVRATVSGNISRISAVSQRVLPQPAEMTAIVQDEPTAPSSN